jgi:hypothetical protein
MTIEYCPKCCKVQNMLATIEDTSEESNNDKTKRTTVSYHCSVCNTFVRSEDKNHVSSTNLICIVNTNKTNFSGVWMFWEGIFH